MEEGSLVQDMMHREVQKLSKRKPGILVFNPSEFTRSSWVDIIAADADVGLPCEAWITTSTSLEKGLASNIKASGFKRYTIVPGEMPEKTACKARPDLLSSPELEVIPSVDGFWVTAIYDSKTGENWLEQHSEYALGEVIYESIPGSFGREKLCDWKGIKRDCPFDRISIRFAAPEVISFPYGAGLRFNAIELPGSLRAITFEIVVYDNLPRIDLFYRLNKYSNAEAEALYVAFPLGSGTKGKSASGKCSKPIVRLNTPGALMRPGLDQVPGTATDCHSIQHYFAVEDREAAIIAASPDIPLVQVNGINTGKWQEILAPHNGLVMSWVLNNYWFTNFPAEQGGIFEWHYSLYHQTGEFDSDAADRFAREIRQPFVAEVIPMED